MGPGGLQTTHLRLRRHWPMRRCLPVNKPGNWTQPAIASHAVAASSSTKKAAKLAGRSSGRSVQFQGGSVFPIALLLVVVLGVAAIVYARQTIPGAGDGARSRQSVSITTLRTASISVVIGRRSTTVTLRSTPTVASITRHTETPACTSTQTVSRRFIHTQLNLQMCPSTFRHCSRCMTSPSLMTP